ncbi:Methyltransferase domain-containing protein [Streptoalloteichus tenebrarius]|uniref:Methyltransferase domain-containing protein n=1 Tax=Streptoalloteichus tenebrarius (strain ATCC 17920 / DSM 40477 / JCM 4838 / CBS 697.72 / NBRC 16177 / NCIMB 11028 / NRRL B-12390 / A12253. 1 / ISP 5477) TaxID=1933 RepID=A0ABT1HQQ5_STRSD|nr:class I SAM-dependent methyltransferase [Streptoalloteichus tenebrarius]MCP2257845.1 Methyltransferase domain-containing protein [Streptoalloteichus tenebrarius]BFE99793.1 class I SAM-dependent methyltransferase [Streptoalloteichus tenebrarius]
MTTATTGSSPLEPDLARAWVRRWDHQQERYIADREERFRIIADVVEHVTRADGEPLVLDLGCGPGSLSARLRARLPRARLLGVDADPLLLAMARAAHPEVGRFLDVDLTSADWALALGVDGPFDAAVSTTALHWLPEDALARLYRDLAGMLRPGGVFVNGDHLYDEQPAIRDLATTVRQRRAERVGVLDNEDWSSWWSAVAEDDRLAGLLAERGRRGLVGGDGNGLSCAAHVTLLREAGFREVAPVWQVGDDFVLAAVR